MFRTSVPGMGGAARKVPGRCGFSASRPPQSSWKSIVKELFVMTEKKSVFCVVRIQILHEIEARRRGLYLPPIRVSGHPRHSFSLDLCRRHGRIM